MQYYCVTVQRKCSYQNIRVQNNGKRTNLTFQWARLFLVPFIRLQRKRNVKRIFCFFFVCFPFEYTSQFHYNIDRSNIDHYTRHENIIHNGFSGFLLCFIALGNRGTRQFMQNYSTSQIWESVDLLFFALVFFFFCSK